MDCSSVYSLYNREYVWSPGYHSVFKSPWVDYEIESGKYRIEKFEYEVPDFEHFEYDKEENTSISFIKKEFERRIPEISDYVQIACAYSRIMWEEEYDATQTEPTLFNIPCQDIMEGLNLKQKDADGYFYTQENELACFDYSLAGEEDCLLIRADFLKRYLEEKNLRLFWNCIGEKQYMTSDLSQEWGKWGGLVYLDGEELKGKLDMLGMNI